MKKTNQIFKKWSSDFGKSEYIDRENSRVDKGRFSDILYGTSEDTGLDFVPLDKWEYMSLEEDEFCNLCCKILASIKINVDRDRVKKACGLEYIGRRKIGDKLKYTFKSLAHRQISKIDNPFEECYGDVIFFAKIESEELFSSFQMTMDDYIPLPEFHSKRFALPDGYGEQERIRSLYEEIEAGEMNFYITGKAGSGKSTFIHYLLATSQRNCLVLSFTGLAAMNAGGQTVHSLFLFPLRILLPEDKEIKKFEKGSIRHDIIVNADLIIIDEISMLRSDTLQAMDYSLRMNTGVDKPFGGKQMLFFGDIYQLPPVLRNSDEIEGVSFLEIYKSPYFFDAPIMKDLPLKFKEFSNSWRQKDDSFFVEILDRIRMNNADEQVLDVLNKQGVTDISQGNEFTIVLCPTNASADNINNSRLHTTGEKIIGYKAKIEGDFPTEIYPCSEEIFLRKNAQVMFARNDPNRRWVNGTLGIIDFVGENRIDVRLKDDLVYEVQPEVWENIKYSFNKKERRIEAKVIGKFFQFPLKLAWSITIHKSQGLSFDSVSIDIRSGAFSNGQLYTALSRCRTMKGLKILGKIGMRDIISDDRISEWERTKSYDKV